VNVQLKKLLENQEFIDSGRFLLKSKKIETDSNAFNKLSLMRKRKTRFSLEKEYDAWVEED
jgi:hypothetical protein